MRLLNQMHRIAITCNNNQVDPTGQRILRACHEIGLTSVHEVRFTRLFFLDGNLNDAALHRIATELLADPITDSFQLGKEGGDSAEQVVEVHLKAGVMDPVAASAEMAIRDMGLSATVRTGRRYHLKGDITREDCRSIAHRLLANDSIEQISLGTSAAPDTQHHKYRFELRLVQIRSLDEAALRQLSRTGHLFLNNDEMKAIQDHFTQIGRDPTDIELETLAQTWSEHCVHKTLTSRVAYNGDPLPSSGKSRVRYDNLLKDTIVRATNALKSAGRGPECLSVFKDNAGVIGFDETCGVAFKVETHNHPSAIEPYGGAATGVGGCIRDVIGTGLAAKPVANTDVFCFAPPDLPNDSLPKGVLHPRRVLKGVVAGVRDYGNRMGIPTVNGAIHFHDHYLGNPLVFCGCVGVIPRDKIEKCAVRGDLIVTVGGRTGRDGIHGATFSSGQLSHTHEEEFAHAVQIGNAIEEKKFLDCILAARDQNLFNAITDCGAGGFSSAVGEMGEKLGAAVELEKVPLKYQGLSYTEIWISESQERMVLAVPPEKWEQFREIFEAENVEATVIGQFSGDRHLTLRYDGQQVGHLSMALLHDGLPKSTKIGTWTKPENIAARPLEPKGGHDLAATLAEKLRDYNTASKQWVIRQYDHEVQGASVVKPLIGARNDGPSDAAVIRPRLDSDNALAIACGICPQYAEIDPYWMAVNAVDECVRNLVCVGSDVERIAILDNFCWGNCGDPEKMGALVRAAQACHDVAMAYATPFISGKDSLNNEFATEDGTVIAIPHTLLISGFAPFADGAGPVTMDAKSASNLLYLVGNVKPGDNPLAVDLETAAKLHRQVAAVLAKQWARSAHDCSEGGLLVAVAEMLIAGRLGAELTADTDWFLESPVRYVLEVRERDCHELQKALPSAIRLGVITETPVLRVSSEYIEIERLREAWQGPLAL